MMKKMANVLLAFALALSGLTGYAMLAFAHDEGVDVSGAAVLSDAWPGAERGAGSGEAVLPGDVADGASTSGIAADDAAGGGSGGSAPSDGTSGDGGFVGEGDRGESSADAPESGVGSAPADPRGTAAGSLAGESRAGETPTFTRFEVYSGKADSSYYTGEESLMYIGVSLSEDAGSFSNGRIEVRIPKKFIKDVVPSPISIPHEVSVEEDAEEWVITYRINAMSSGVSIDMPFKFKNIVGPTPDGYRLSVSATAYDADGSVVKVADIVPVTYKTNPLAMTKDIYKDSGGYTSNNGETVTAGKENADRPGYITGETSDLAKVRFVPSLYYSMDSGSSETGYRLIEKVVFEDVVPLGATFYPSDNPLWVYDEETRTARLELEYPEGIRPGSIKHQDDLSLYLRFPNEAIGSSYTNTMKATLYPLGQEPYEADLAVKDDITFSIKSSKPVPQGSVTKRVSPYFVYDYEDKKESWRPVGTLSFGNTMEEPLSNMSIVDSGLDKALMIIQVSIPATPATVFSGTVTLSVKLRDGTTKIIESGIDVASGYTVDFPDSDDVVGFTVKGDEGSVLLPGEFFTVKETNKLKDPAGTVTTDERTKYMYNSVTASGVYEEAGPFEKSARATMELRPAYYMSVGLSKSMGTSQAFMEDEVETSLIYQVNSPVHEQVVEAPVVVDLLPTGFEYVAGSSTVAMKNPNRFSLVDAGAVIDVAPAVVENYRGSGRTALVWHLPAFECFGGEVTSSLYTVYNISFSSRVTKHALPGKSDNIGYAGWGNVDEIRAYKSDRVEDVYDINDNGLTDDEVAKEVAPITYIPPKEVIASKSVKGSLDHASTVIGEGVTEAGGSAVYTISVYNNSVFEVERLAIVDILPHVGDRELSSNVGTGGRPERGSEFDVRLTGPVVAPSGYTVAYTSSDPGDALSDMKAFVDSAVWVAAPAEYASVTAVLVTLDDGQKLGKEERATLEMPVKTPEGAVSLGKSAINTFAVSTAENMTSFESNKVGLKTVAYRVDGYVFEDLNEDSVYQPASDTPIAGASVRLVHRDGTPVEPVDANGGVVFETDPGGTDADGYYAINVYRQGDYRVEITAPKGHVAVGPSDDAEYGSHILDGATGLTDVFPLNPSHAQARKNGGFLHRYVDVTGIKVWQGGPSERPSIELQLFCNGEPLGEPVTLEDGTTAHTWTDLEKADGEGREYVYEVDEVEVPAGYEKSTDGFTVTNTYIPEEVPVVPVDPARPADPVDPAANTAPQTGDTAWVLVFGGVALLAAAVVLAAAVRRRRLRG